MSDRYHFLSMAKRPQKSIEDIISEDGRYPLDAVQFVRDGLNFTVGQVYGKATSSGQRRHVSGAQLCQGLRALALNRWGLLSRQVLNRWNIDGTRDFGEIVFMMVENGWMQKEPGDSLEDFENVYEFETAFGKDFDLPTD